MIKVNIDTKGAEIILDIFQQINEEGSVPEKKVEELMNLKVMDYFVQHANIFSQEGEGVTKDDVKGVIMGLCDEKAHYDKEELQKIHDRYIDQMKKVDSLRGKIQGIVNNFNKKAIEEKLLKYLPDNTDLESTTYIICTSGSGGYFKEGNIILDLEYISQNANKINDTTAHELHHIAYGTIYQSIVHEDELDTRHRIMGDLLNGLIGEGIAYYCMGGIPKEGDLGYEEFQEDIGKEIEYFKDMNDTFKRIIEGNLTTEEFMEWVSKHMSERYGEINYIGIKMIETIYRVFGLEEMKELLFSPDTFIARYNEAAEALIVQGEDHFRYEEEVVKGVKDFVKVMAIIEQ